LLAGLIGCYLLLALAGITASEITQRPSGFVEPGVKVLLVTVVIVVTAPVLTLAATTARLAAATRDRRLANLRLLGLSARRTRMVAATEVGVAATTGALAGGAAFLITRPLIADIHLAGRSWPLNTLVPHWPSAAAALLLVPVTVILVAMLPRIGRSEQSLGMVRRGAPPRPRLVRLLPLALGAGLAVFVIVGAEDQYADGAGNNRWLVPYLFAGIALLAAGTLTAVPWLVRVVADLLVRSTSRPASLIAGRRLQAQPSGVTRIIAGLLIGLFIVAGSRAVVVAFEDTPQYRSAAMTESTGQVGTLQVDHRHPAMPVIRRLQADPNVAALSVFTHLETDCKRTNDPCFRSYVGTCAALHEVFPSVTGCSDDGPTLLQVRDDWTPDLIWRTRPGAREEGALPAPVAQLKDSGLLSIAALDGLVLFPPRLPQVQRLTTSADTELLIRATPGVPIEEVLDEVMGDFGNEVLEGSYPGNDYYVFVSGLRALVWAVAILVVLVGLLAFVISAVDRALMRRTEATALQLVGVPARVLRRSQRIEALAPLGLGTALSIGLGLLAGSSFLAYGSILELAPLRPTLLLALIALVGSGLVAGMVGAMATPSIRAENIRNE
jgi:hypothetical protein